MSNIHSSFLSFPHLAQPETIRPNTGRMPKAKNIIAVASGKGGVGKTWFSISLSQAMAKRGNKVLLFDGDLGLANVDVQLGLMPRHDLSAQMRSGMPMKNIVTHFESGNFDVIAGRSGAANLASIPMQQIAKMSLDLMDISSSYDVVVIDLGAGIDRTVRQLAAVAGHTIIVLNDEPTSLTDAYAYIKLSYNTTDQQDIRLLINSALSQEDGRKTYHTISKACQTFLGVTPPLLGVIRMDKRVKETIKRQTPILTSYPGTDAAQDIESITNQVLRLL